MKNGIVHLFDYGTRIHYAFGACGKRVDATRVTSNTKTVTCRSCIRTESYRRSARQTAIDDELNELFTRLAQQWKDETLILSDAHKILLHPCYQRIIGMGPAVIPILLSAMQDKPDHWGHALQAITGEWPVPAEHSGNIKKIADAWVRWGKDNGYLPHEKEEK
jgi:hypothetical protein